jgi:hypothetical protein
MPPNPLREQYGSEPKPARRETIDGFFQGDIYFGFEFSMMSCTYACLVGIVPFTRTLEVVLARAER